MQWADGVQVAGVAVGSLPGQAFAFFCVVCGGGEEGGGGDGV